MAKKNSWYVKPMIGGTGFEDSDAQVTTQNNNSDKLDVEPDLGFTYGVGIGYFFSDNIALEIAYQNHDNDADMKTNDGNEVFEGDIRVEYLTFNAYWFVQPKGNWRPYLGVGAGITSNAEVNVETLQNDLSLESDGDIVAQMIIGADFMFTKQLSLLTQFTYTNIELTDLKKNSANQRFDDLQHNPISLQVGLLYSF